MIAPETLQSILHYNPGTGEMRWKETVNSRAKAGDIAGTVRDKGRYMSIGIFGKRYQVHRVAWSIFYRQWPINFIDHIDGNPSNNVLSNLRVATKRSNAENMKGPTSASSTGRLGVFKDTRSGKFVSQIRINGKRKSLGVFASVDAAYDAYLAAKRVFHSGSLL